MHAGRCSPLHPAHHELRPSQASAMRAACWGACSPCTAALPSPGQTAGPASCQVLSSTAECLSSLSPSEMPGKVGSHQGSLLGRVQSLHSSPARSGADSLASELPGAPLRLLSMSVNLFLACYEDSLLGHVQSLQGSAVKFGHAACWGMCSPCKAAL